MSTPKRRITPVMLTSNKKEEQEAERLRQIVQSSGSDATAAEILRRLTKDREVDESEQDSGEEVTKAFNDAGVYDKPKDGRAWGAVYLRAVKEGVMHKGTEVYAREFGNGSPGLKWVSNVYVKRTKRPMGADAQLPLGSF